MFKPADAEIAHTHGSQVTVRYERRSYVRESKPAHGASRHLLDTAHKPSDNENIVHAHIWYAFNTVLLST